MKELIEKITAYQRQLESGKMQASDIEPMLQCVRDLEEQLIVLRYKAFEPIEEKKEETIAEKPFPILEETTEESTIEEPIMFSFDAPTVEEESEVKTEEAPKEEPVEVVEHEVSENQTSLIDAIAEMQENVSVNDKLATEVPDDTLAEKLRRMPIDDLKRAIGLNQKFWFISNLFNEDGEAYNQFIERINNQSSLEDAMEIVNKEIKSQFNWEEVEDKSVKKFLDYVERRFLQEA